MEIGLKDMPERRLRVMLVGLRYQKGRLCNFRKASLKDHVLCTNFFFLKKYKTRSVN